MCMCAQLLSCVQLFATPWTVAHQAPLSKGFSWQNYWRELLFPSLGDLPDPDQIWFDTDQICVSHVSCIAGRFFTFEPPGKPQSGV